MVATGDGWLDAEPEIERLRPDIYAVNEDGDRPEKREYCQAHGIEYRVLKRLPKEGLPRRQSTDLAASKKLVANCQLRLTVPVQFPCRLRSGQFDGAAVLAYLEHLLQSGLEFLLVGHAQFLVMGQRSHGPAGLLGKRWIVHIGNDEPQGLHRAHGQRTFQHKRASSGRLASGMAS